MKITKDIANRFSNLQKPKILSKSTPTTNILGNSRNKHLKSYIRNSSKPVTTFISGIRG